MQHNFGNPIYEICINTRECAVVLMVNDIPCFSNYNHGGMAVDWPINTTILKTGKQFFSLKILPYTDEFSINKKAFVELKIAVRDGLDNSKPKITISNFESIDFSKFKDELPYHNIFHEFYADVPYNHIGWEDSQIISKEKENDLLVEIDDFYSKLLTIFRSANIESYKQLNAERFNELCNSFYLTLFEMQRREVTLIPKFCGMIQKEKIEKYQLSFYGEGRIVGINIPFEPVGLKFNSDNQEDGYIYEQALFHRKKSGDKLSVIR